MQKSSLYRRCLKREHFVNDIQSSLTAHDRRRLLEKAAHPQRQAQPGGQGDEGLCGGAPNTRSCRRRPVGVAARPPSAVSRSDCGMASPTRFMARMASSAGMGLCTPASASCAATSAPATPEALR